MTENLDSLTEDMDSQFADSQPEGLNKLDKKLSELMDQVNDLETNSEASRTKLRMSSKRFFASTRSAKKR